MDTQDSAPHGFGTTSEEWALLQLAYSIAVSLAADEGVPEEVLVRFRHLDEAEGLMFESWWNTRPEF
jgi:hypothetical protein